VNTEVCPLCFDLGTGDYLAELAAAHGFEDVLTKRVTTVLRYDDEESALAAAFAGGPVAMAYSRFEEGTRAEAHEEYLETISEYRNGSGYGIPGEFVAVRRIAAC
jgi:hypothetical protein